MDCSNITRTGFDNLFFWFFILNFLSMLIEFITFPTMDSSYLAWSHFMRHIANLFSPSIHLHNISIFASFSLFDCIFKITLGNLANMMFLERITFDKHTAFRTIFDDKIRLAVIS